MSRGAPSAAKKPTTERKVRTRKCAIATCRTPFPPRSMTHKCCSPECAQAFAALERQRADRKDTRDRLVKLQSKSHHAAAAQKAVNRYVNLRDRDKDCVSCGKPASAGGVRNASHFKSVGANSALRFNLWNIHTSCYRCNVELSGNLGEYYPRLIARIGAIKVDHLQFHPRERRYEIDYLQRLQKVFNRKSKRLIKNNP